MSNNEYIHDVLRRLAGGVKTLDQAVRQAAGTCPTCGLDCGGVLPAGKTKEQARICPHGGNHPSLTELARTGQEITQADVDQDVADMERASRYDDDIEAAHLEHEDEFREHSL
jgi:hypothetical protein